MKKNVNTMIIGEMDLLKSVIKFGENWLLKKGHVCYVFCYCETFKVLVLNDGF